MKRKRPVIPSIDRDGTPFPRPWPDARDTVADLSLELRRTRRDLERATRRLRERSATLTDERRRNAEFLATVREALRVHETRYFAGYPVTPAILHEMIIPTT